MKTKYILNSCLLLVLLFCLIATSAKAETSAQKKQRTRLKMYYEKLPDNNKKISLILTQGSGKKASGVQQAQIHISTLVNEEPIELTTVETNANGEAIFIVEAGYEFSMNEDGYSVIMARYDGNDSLRSAKKKIEFKDLNVEISFDVIDSANHVVVYAFETDSIGEKSPIEGIDLNIGVERLYSTYFFEEVETDEDGMASVVFPDDIPGDDKGNVKVMVKIDEHDDYGTITKTADVNWGTIVDYSITSNGRSLFGDQAPTWMIITTFILLVGAWYHFILATAKVVKIKKLGKEQD